MKKKYFLSNKEYVLENNSLFSSKVIELFLLE